jgi:hypothetical protein
MLQPPNAGKRAAVYRKNSDNASQQPKNMP